MSTFDAPAPHPAAQPSPTSSADLQPSASAPSAGAPPAAHPARNEPESAADSAGEIGHITIQKKELGEMSPVERISALRRTEAAPGGAPRRTEGAPKPVAGAPDRRRPPSEHGRGRRHHA